MTMTRSQLTGMIKFHRKAEKAYRAAGLMDQARRARTLRANLLSQLKSIKGIKPHDN